MYKAIKLSKGAGGWGGPLVLCPDETRNVILNVTGGGILPLSQEIADACGGTAFDGFTSTVTEDRILCAVIDCGGVARCGVYPKKRIPTINITAIGPSGPLAQFITEDIYVSGQVKVEVATDAEASGAVTFAPSTAPVGAAAPITPQAPAKKPNVVASIGKSVGSVINKIFAAARDSVDTVLRTVIPFMVFISLIVGVINYTGIGTWIANAIAPAVSSLPGMLLICVICAIPVLSPILGPGAVIAQIVGVLIGTQIGAGAIPPAYALPALFAIDPQVGGDFIPVGLSLGDATPETVEVGVPAILFSRLITGPIAVILAFAVSFAVGLYH